MNTPPYTRFDNSSSTILARISLGVSIAPLLSGGDEPPRESRRVICLSQAAIAGPSFKALEGSYGGRLSRVAQL